MALYNATDGANWTNNANWLSNRPLGEWHGVTTDMAGRVSGLDLTQNNLSGTIPSELGDLSNLENLELGANRLSGPIPSELGRLTILETLYLYETQLSGPIPTELGQLANLIGLYLHENQLNGLIPVELGQLANLVVLALSGNQLSGSIPPELGDLAKLEGIFLGGSNQFSGCIPSGLGNVPDGDLSTLGLEYCGVSSDRAALVALYNATNGPNWTKRDNWLSTTAPLGDWHGVTTNGAGRVTGLDLGKNNLSGPLPAELGLLDNLTELVLAENLLSGPIPVELGNLTNLEVLGLSGNLTGSIPPELGNLANLKVLVITGPLLSGSIPPELGKLANLETLILTGTALSGPIPLELGNLSKLTVLSLANNNLTGPIPPELGNLSQLEGLYLDDNLLTGPVPDSFLDLRQLGVFSIERNNGLCLPATDAFLSQAGFKFGGQFCQGEDHAALVALYETTGGTNWNDNQNWLRNDRPLQEWAGVATDAEGRVSGLDLASNNLVGSIPPELGTLSQLSYLALNNNQLTGSVPPELGSLAELSVLDLGNNQFTGSLPPELGNLANLEWLNLSDNNLSGPIPSELGNLVRLQALALNNNDLVGPIPSELGNLQQLEHLELQNNSELSGRLPTTLTALVRLRLLDAESTDLCITNDSQFRAWLESIPYSRIRFCAWDFELVSGNFQFALPGTPLPEPIIMRVLDATGVPVAGATVRFTPDPGHGAANPSVVTTDVAGRVQTVWTLGPTTGRQELRARVDESSWAIFADATTPDSRVVSIMPVFGHEPATYYPEQEVLVAVRALDRLGRSVEGATVVFQPTSGDGSANPSRVVTNAQGEAQTTWTMGYGDYVQSLIAYVTEDISYPFLTSVAFPDRYALEALYHNMGGTDWTNQKNWTTDAPLEEWFGVSVDAAGSLIAVELDRNGLSGRIPPMIGAFAFSRPTAS